jgi:toxin-antitoxin system PIN domain toxin
LIALDSNVLVYADRADLPLHVKARERLYALASGMDPWALPVFCIAEFVRVVTNPRFFSRPTPLPEALKAVEALLESPTARLLVPGPRFWSVLRHMATEARVAGDAVFAAQIAAVCRESGVNTILTEDRGFERFSGITVQRLSAA